MEKTPDLQFVSWSQFHAMGFDLSQQLIQLKPDLDTIVSVARGGHVLARILSDFLDLPIFSVSIQSYTSIEQQGELEITQELGVDLVSKHVLLVDEITDSGKTLVRALEYLAGLGAQTVTSVSLHVKPQAVAKPDFYVEETTKWVVYPYEVRETIKSLVPIWKSAQWSVDQMVETLVGGGFERAYVSQVMSQGLGLH